MSPPISFKSLYVASDLHLGGTPASKQIFNQGEQFAEVVDELRTKPKGELHGLVLNGDLVDFLAEPNALYFDALGAADKLDRIISDPSFEPVWKALRRYVKTKDRALIITLGNHDLELALPALRRQLMQELAEGDTAACGRITLAFEQEGFRARVGNAGILCLHGNEVDLWNVTDYEQLRRMCRDSDRGAALPHWTPNAGTKLVIDVMNAIKKRYAFVDLLKPETQAVLPTLLVLDPSQAERISEAIPSVLHLGWDRLRRAFGFLEDPEMAMPIHRTDTGTAGERMLGAFLEEALGSASGASLNLINEGELLRRAESNFQGAVTPRALLRLGGEPEFLNVRRAIWNFIRRKGKSEVLREALEYLLADRSFDRSTPDATFRALEDRVPKEIDFVTAGHTHLERALPMRGGRYYFNSGTWVRLIQLTPEILRNETQFQAIFRAVEDGNMAALDAAKAILSRPTVVAFWCDHSGTHGALQQQVKGKLQTIEGTPRFTKG